MCVYKICCSNKITETRPGHKGCGCNLKKGIYVGI